MIANDGERSDGARAQPFLVLALIGCLAAIGGMVAIALVSDRQNATEAARETAAIRAAAASEIVTMEQRLWSTLALRPLSALASPAAKLSGPFQRLVLLDPSLSTRAADPLVAAAAGLLVPPERARVTPANGPAMPAHSALLQMEDTAYFALAAQVEGTDANGRMRALVALEPLDDTALGRMAHHAGTAPLFARAARHSTEASVGFPAPHGTQAVTLVWEPNRPGDAFFRTAGAVFGGLGLLFAIAALVSFGRVTRALARSEERAKTDASHDLLTGVANRTAFSRELQRNVERVSRSGARGFALIYLDIDRFKDINDTYGHGAGDRVISTTAHRIAGCLREGSLVGRIGGDEFGIIAGDGQSPADYAALARNILAACAEPMDLEANKTLVTVSVGIALCPHDALSADGIINSADLALYRAKRQGRNRFCFFEQRMGEDLRMRKTVEEDLRVAILEDQLLIEYQPVFSLEGRKMVGVEALVRWRHPTKGMIAPGSFITLAEESGLILPLGEWVMRRALREARRWPNLRVAVNVSAIQFRQKNFVATVQKMLAEAGVEATQLELELTESVLLADADQAEDAMIELRAMGVRLALDDFGTGYASLIYLRRFAFDKIKIDRSFLESMESTGESAIIVHSIVHLGRALGLTVTAEGVETQEQHRFMQALGCHELQGFLFSPPVHADAIDRRLAQAPALLRSVA